MKKIAIACDHAGFQYKERLVEYFRSLGHEVKDFGCHSEESMDYPDTAHPLAAAVENPSIVKIPTVLVNGTGTGYEGAAAVLGASNLLETLKGLDAKQKKR